MPPPKITLWQRVFLSPRNRKTTHHGANIPLPATGIFGNLHQ